MTLEPPLSSSPASPNQYAERGAPCLVPSSYFLDNAMEFSRAAEVLSEVSSLQEAP
jgi:hypothetical protein